MINRTESVFNAGENFLDVDFEKNYLSYPESHEKYGVVDNIRLGIIREKLLALPLVHNTSRNIEEIDKLSPSSDLGVEGHSTPFDASLGLNQATFFYLSPPVADSYGGNFIYIDTARILIKDRCVVTPRDVMETTTAWVNCDLPFQQQEFDARQEIVDKYFNKMVLGTQWLDIISKKIHKHQKLKIGGFEIQQRNDLGEVKFFASVSSEMMLNDRYKSTEDVKKMWTNSGFVFPNLG